MAKLQPAEPWGTSRGAPAKYERWRAGIHTGGVYPSPVAGAHPVRRQLSASPSPAPLRAFFSQRRRPGGARCRPVSTLQPHPTIHPDSTLPRAPAWLWLCRRSAFGLPSFQPAPVMLLTSGARGLDAGRGRLPAGPTFSTTTRQGGQATSLSFNCDLVTFQLNYDCSLATSGPTGEVRLAAAK